MTHCFIKLSQATLNESIQALVVRFDRTQKMDWQPMEPKPPPRPNVDGVLLFCIIILYYHTVVTFPRALQLK